MVQNKVPLPPRSYLSGKGQNQNQTLTVTSGSGNTCAASTTIQHSHSRPGPRLQSCLLGSANSGIQQSDEGPECGREGMHRAQLIKKIKKISLFSFSVSVTDCGEG